MRPNYPPSPALNVVRKIGGDVTLSQAIERTALMAERDVVTVRRWLNGETGGEIPRSSRERILANAAKAMPPIDIGLADFFTIPQSTEAA